MYEIFTCVFWSVVDNGVKGLFTSAPGGQWLYDVGEGAWKRLKERKEAAKRRAQLAEAIRATNDQARATAERVVREGLAARVGAGTPVPELSPADQRCLEFFLTAIPCTARESLKRPEDPTGTTVPANFRLDTPEDVLKLLPTRLPRFLPGAELPCRPGWVLEDLLGLGGFGEVWLARHSHQELTSLRGAVKFCLDQSALNLIHEGSLINRVMKAGRSAHVVPLLDAHLDGDTPWLLYEYVSGGNLMDWMRSRAGLPAASRLAEVTDAMRQLSEAVGYFHGLVPPIVHRDLKPSNILLAEDGRTLLVTDFGIGGITAGGDSCDVARGGSRQAGMLRPSLLGSHTPRYASPQQRNGAPPDPRDDIYALGVIWYQMLIGDLTAEAPTGVKWQKELAERGLRDPAISLLAACTEPDRENRPADAKELARQLALEWPGAVDPIRLDAARDRSHGNAAESIVQTTAATAPSTPNVPSVSSGSPAAVAGVGRQLRSPRQVWAMRLIAGATISLAVCLCIYAVWHYGIRRWIGPVSADSLVLGHTIHNHGLLPDKIAFGKDGGSLAVLNYEKRTLTLWDAATGEELVSPLPGEDFVHSPDAQILAVAHEGQSTLLDSHTGRIIAQVAGKPTLFSPDGTLLVTVDSSKLKLWDVKSGQLRTLMPPYNDGAIALPFFSVDGQTFGALAENNTIALWDAKTGALRRGIRMRGTGIASVAVSQDVKLLAAASMGARSTDPKIMWDVTASTGSVEVWDLATGEAARPLNGNLTNIERIVFSPDGRRLIGWPRGHRKFAVWDTTSGEQRTLPVSNEDARDGRANVTFDGSVIVWKESRDSRSISVWNLVTNREFTLSADSFTIGHWRTGSKNYLWCGSGQGGRLYDLATDERGRSIWGAPAGWTEDGGTLEFPTDRGQRESGVLLKHEETHRWPASARRTRRSSNSRR